MSWSEHFLVSGEALWFWMNEMDKKARILALEARLTELERTTVRAVQSGWVAGSPSSISPSKIPARTKVTPIKRSVVIEIPVEAAETLSAVISNISGNPDRARGQLLQIQQLLTENGVKPKLFDGSVIIGALELT